MIRHKNIITFKISKSSFSVITYSPVKWVEKGNVQMHVGK